MTSMEDDLNGRRPQWMTTSMEDVLNGRRTQWKTTSMEDDPHDQIVVPVNKELLTIPVLVN